MTASKYFPWTGIRKSPFTGGMWFKFGRQKEADPIPCILQDTDLHFLCTLMKQQPSCPPPLTPALILHRALTTLCALVCASVGAHKKYVRVCRPVMCVSGCTVCLYNFTAKSSRERFTTVYGKRAHKNSPFKSIITLIMTFFCLYFAVCAGLSTFLIITLFMAL